MAEDLLGMSPFRDKLNTNYNPSSDEAVDICRFLGGPREELKAYEEEVSRARISLDFLIQKHKRLQEAIKAHEALISPIRRIPKELLQEIFIRCLPNDHRPILSNSRAPLLLSRVSKPWRNLAFATPGLWATLHIPIPFALDETNQLFVTSQRNEAVRRWLGMSGDTPLSISLYWPHRMTYSWGTGHRIPRTIICYSHRLRDIELTLPNDELVLFAQLSPEDVPLLERIALYLKTPSEEESRGARIAEKDIWLAPRLRKVIWSHVHDDFLKLPLNWAQLVEINVDGSGMVPLSFISVNDARALLERCSDLVKCSIQLCYYDDPRQPDQFPHTELPETITLWHLTILVLSDSVFDSDLPILLNHIELPNLRHLSYRVYVEDGDLCPLLIFLQRQVNPILIETLNIHTTSLSTEQFLDCLRHMPLLSWLAILDLEPLTSNYWNSEKVVLDDQFLLPLTPSHDRNQSFISPLLEYLQCPRANFWQNGLKEFVKSRTSGEFASAGVACLKSLSVGLTYPQPIDGDGRRVDLAAMLRELGLDDAQVVFSGEETIIREANPVADGLRVDAASPWLL